MPDGQIHLRRPDPTIEPVASLDYVLVGVK